MSETNNQTTTSPAWFAATAAPAPVAPLLKKEPTPVFSIPATATNKEFITKQSERTGKTQKELLMLAITAATELILGLPDYAEPVPEVTTTASPPRECCQASNWCW